MKITKLFVKEKQGMRVKECQAIALQRGFGIAADVHAIAGSPRQILLASTSSLAAFDLNPGDLGENILLDGEIEQFGSGQVLQVGEKARIRLTFRCEPCANLDKIHPSLSKIIKRRRGFLGIAVANGAIAIGDEVSLTPDRLPAIPDDAKGRFSEFVRRIPPGKVVNTADLLLALGASRSYYRAVPTFLKKAAPDLPVHRIVRADGRLLSEYISQQKQLLIAEGVEVADNRIKGDNFYWAARHFHDLG